MAGHRTTTPRAATFRRRIVSVPMIPLGGVLLLVLLPIWVPIMLVVDLVTAPKRLPRTRLLFFGLCWFWLETGALLRIFFVWVTGGADDLERMTGAQRWWATNLLRALRLTAGMRVEIEGLEAITPGRAIVMARHACLADSLVTAWSIVGAAGKRVRFVLKRELLSDPCLDIAGNRLQNHFLDRHATDSGPELDALRALTVGLGPDECGAIYPEGTRANPKKRARALEKIGERDPARAQRLAGLRHLIPPRPAGALAMLEGAPDADVVLAWHIGFDGMDTFPGILAGVPPLFVGRTIRFAARRVPRSEVPAGEAFTEWLDQRWLELDAEVDAALAEARA